MCIAGFFTRYLCVLVISVAYVSILALPLFYLLVLIFFGWFSDLWSQEPCKRDVFVNLVYSFSYLYTTLISSMRVCREESIVEILH